MKLANPIIKSAFSSELVEFFKNLALLTRSGIPLDEAMGVLGEQTRSSIFRKFLLHTKHQMEQGSTLSDALMPYQAYVGEMSINIIKAGEINGTLEANLNYVAQLLMRSRDLKQRIQSALLYPEIVLVMAFIVGGGIAMVILPKLIPLFKSMGVNLPLASRMLLAMSLFFQKHGIYALLGAAGSIIALLIIAKIGPIRWVIHSVTLRIPFIGSLARNYQLAIFSQLFGTLFHSGLTIKEALIATSDAMTNVRYRNALARAANRMATGIPLSTVLKKYPSYFPQNVISILAVGESSGKLDDSMSYLATYYDNEVDVQTKRLPTYMEPFILLVIGAIVLFIALAIISPIYELTSSIHPK
ncbi:MAG: type II secretion system F family protein [Patescibacteria group bacterium]